MATFVSSGVWPQFDDAASPAVADDLDAVTNGLTMSWSSGPSEAA